MMNALVRGARLGARTLRANVAAFVIPTIILAAGLTVVLVTASIADNVTAPRLPFVDSENLRVVVQAGGRTPTSDVTRMRVDVRAVASEYAKLTAYRNRERLVVAADTAAYLTVQYVPSNFFGVVAGGRAQALAELGAHATSGSAILSSTGRRRLFGSSSARDEVISVDDVAWRVVATAPTGFAGASAFAAPDVWLVDDAIEFIWGRDTFIARSDGEPNVVAERLAADLGLPRSIVLRDVSEIDSTYAQGLDQVTVLLALFVSCLCAVVVAQLAGLCLMIRPDREGVWRIQQQLGAQRWKIMVEWLGEASVSGLVAYGVAIAASIVTLRILRATVAATPTLRLPPLLLSPGIAAGGALLVVIVAGVGSVTLFRTTPNALRAVRIRPRWGVPGAMLLALAVFLAVTGAVSMKTVFGVRERLLPQGSERLIAVSLRPAEDGSDLITDAATAEISTSLGARVVAASPLPMFAAPTGRVRTPEGMTVSGVRVIRADMEFFEIMGLPVVVGSVNAWESGSVIVIDEGLAGSLFGSSMESLGRAVDIEGKRYTVVALTARTTFGIVSATGPPLAIVPADGGGRNEGMLVALQRNVQRDDIGTIRSSLPNESVRYIGTYRALVLRADRIPEVAAVTLGVLAVVASLVTLVALQIGVRIAILARGRDIATRIAIGGRRWVAVYESLRKPLAANAVAIAMGCAFSGGTMPLLAAVLGVRPPMDGWVVMACIMLAVWAGAVVAVVGVTSPGERELVAILKRTQ